MDTMTAPSRSRERWIAVGQSSEADAWAAGAAATRQALDGGDGRLLVVFCSDSYDLAALLAGINEASGGVPLIGCSTAGEIATSGPGDASVVVVALGGTGYSIRTAVATGVSSRLREAGAEAAACIEGVDDKPHRIMLLLTDGLAGDQQEVVRGAYGVLGAGVPLVGGCAGDDLKMTRTFQVHGDGVLTDAVVAAGIASDAPLGIGVRPGGRKLGGAMLVNRGGGKPGPTPHHP